MAVNRVSAVATAIGELVMVHPEAKNSGWVCVCFRPSGRWQSMSWHATKEAAVARRSELFKWHRKLAKIRAARAVKRRKN